MHFLKVIFFSWMVCTFCCCQDGDHKKPAANDRNEMVPEPDKDLREKYEAEQQLKQSGCVFDDPDTSICGLELLGDEASAMTFFNEKDEFDENDLYHFYSLNQEETLSILQSRGGHKYKAESFKVSISDKADHGFRKLAIVTFKTEKGIHLGMNKKQIQERLGFCYITKDSTKNYIELNYRLESPMDSKTKILKTKNTPVYYAAYRFRNDKLDSFEFGFEYN
jgi:hypothetical protein